MGTTTTTANPLVDAVLALGGEILPDNDSFIRRIQVPSSSSSAVYIVQMVVGTTEWECNCPAWRNKKPNQPRNCKHLKVMAQHFGLAPSPAAIVMSPVVSLSPAPAPATLLIPPRCTAEMPAITCEDPLTHAFTPDHAGEKKMNGEREMLYLGFDPYARREGTTMLSRQKSKHDDKFGDKTDNVPHITGTTHDQHGTVLDGEVFLTDWSTTRKVMGSSPGIAAARQKEFGNITFYVFDVPFHKGKDIRKLPLRERRKVLAQVIAELNNPNIVMLEQTPHDKIDVAFRREVEAGGEGYVVKNLNATYGEGWAKYKKAADVSCIIIGYVAGKGAFKGMVGSIELGVWNGGKVVSVGGAGGFTLQLRQEITDNQASYLGRVVDIFAFELTAAEKISNGTFHRWREDINSEDCTLEKIKDDLKKVLGNRKK